MATVEELSAPYANFMANPLSPSADNVCEVCTTFTDGYPTCFRCASKQFDIVTTVPSRSAERDEHHPLKMIVGSMVEPTQRRYERLLMRSSADAADRTVDIEKYAASRLLAGESILLIDDTWTTGASMQSAAGRLKACGSGPVAGLVIGRHMNEGFGNNAGRLESLPEAFDWHRCALCSER